MTNRIMLNETSYFGSGSRQNLINEVKSRKFKHLLIVTDETLLKVGVTRKVTDLLDENQINYTIFSNVRPNPTIDNCHEGLQMRNKCKADCLVAVGGGSVIDTAKCIGIMTTNTNYYDINKLEGVADTPNKSLPIIALPTTAGTAAEVTINYVITNEEEVRKLVCVDPHDIPIISIIDSDLMKDMPKLTAASTGLDALTHAMEGYITKAHWEMTDMFHLKSIEMTYHNLEKAVNKDEKAMENMGLSQYIAGMGFSNVGLGIVHSMAHQLGATYGIAHGIACALFLPYVLEFNGSICPKRFREMGKAFDIDMNGKTDEEAISLIVNAVRELETKLGVPQHLRDLNINKEDFEVMAEKAFNDPCTPGNPRDVTKEDILSLYEIAY